MKVRKNNTRKRRSLGFSLLELLAVVTILGIIAVVVIPRIAVSSNTAKVNAQAQTVSEINAALERHYFDYGSFPTLANLWVTTNPDGQKYFPDGQPIDPLTGVAFVDTGYTTTLGRVSP